MDSSSFFQFMMHCTSATPNSTGFSIGHLGLKFKLRREGGEAVSTREMVRFNILIIQDTTRRSVCIRSPGLLATEPAMLRMSHNATCAIGNHSGQSVL